MLLTIAMLPGPGAAIAALSALALALAIGRRRARRLRAPRRLERGLRLLDGELPSVSAGRCRVMARGWRGVTPS